MVAACKMSFDSAHVLWGYRGKCGNLHGHTYNAEVGVELRPGKQGNKMGMVVDYNELKPIIKSILDEYDHAFIRGSEDNDTLVDFLSDMGFKIKRVEGYSTTENIARQILREICEYSDNNSTSWRVVYVRVAETGSTYAEVRSNYGD